MPLIDCRKTNWSFKRIVFDRRSKQQRTAIGRSIITDNHFLESGLWTYPVFKSPIIFNQSYRLNYLNSNVFQVCFDDTNKIFFDLNLDEYQPVIKHVCGDDHYYGVFKINRHNSQTKFYLGWQVKGPRKDYTMKTLYKIVRAATY